MYSKIHKLCTYSKIQYQPVEFFKVLKTNIETENLSTLMLDQFIFNLLVSI